EEEGAASRAALGGMAWRAYAWLTRDGGVGVGALGSDGGGGGSGSRASGGGSRAGGGGPGSDSGSGSELGDISSWTGISKEEFERVAGVIRRTWMGGEADVAEDEADMAAVSALPSGSLLRCAVVLDVIRVELASPSGHHSSSYATDAARSATAAAAVAATAVFASAGTATADLGGKALQISPREKLAETGPRMWPAPGPHAVVLTLGVRDMRCSACWRAAGSVAIESSLGSAVATGVDGSEILALRPEGLPVGSLVDGTTCETAARDDAAAAAAVDGDGSDDDGRTATTVGDGSAWACGCGGGDDGGAAAAAGATGGGGCFVAVHCQVDVHPSDLRPSLGSVADAVERRAEDELEPLGRRVREANFGLVMTVCR
ncbi:unnamed protein product, partial [Phaeothamnion confervicola]